MARSLLYLKAMKVALPVWNSRISPLFDTARNLLVAEVEEGDVLSRAEVRFEEYYPPRRVNKLVKLGVNTLICGAISRQFAAMLIGSGITIVPWMSGLVEDVLQAYLEGRLSDHRFLMPGCRWRGPRGKFHGGMRRVWWQTRIHEDLS